jgi:hypothetical protein
VGPRAGLYGCGKSPPATGLRCPDCPAHSESLYRLSYPGLQNVRRIVFRPLARARDIPKTSRSDQGPSQPTTQLVAPSTPKYPCFLLHYYDCIHKIHFYDHTIDAVLHCLHHCLISSRSPALMAVTCNKGKFASHVAFRLHQGVCPVAVSLTLSVPN